MGTDYQGKKLYTPLRYDIDDNTAGSDMHWYTPKAGRKSARIRSETEDSKSASVLVNSMYCQSVTYAISRVTCKSLLEINNYLHKSASPEIVAKQFL